MLKNTFTKMLMVILVFGMVTFTSGVRTVDAQMITSEQIAAQGIEVQKSMVVTLTEHVKLLQMVLIRNLEARVAQLQAQIDANN